MNFNTASFLLHLVFHCFHSKCLSFGHNSYKLQNMENPVATSWYNMPIVTAVAYIYKQTLFIKWQLRSHLLCKCIWYFFHFLNFFLLISYFETGILPIGFVFLIVHLNNGVPDANYRKHFQYSVSLLDTTSTLRES